MKKIDFDKIYKRLSKQSISYLTITNYFIIDEKNRRLPLMAKATKEYCDPNQGDYLPGHEECLKCPLAIICAHNAIQLGRIILNEDELADIKTNVRNLMGDDFDLSSMENIKDNNSETTHNPVQIVKKKKGNIILKNKLKKKRKP